MLTLIKSTFHKEKITKERLIKFIRDQKKLSFGPECELFEKNFGSFQKRRECVFFNNGSTANLAVFQALKNMGKLRDGDKVAFSAVTWSTNVMPLFQLGLNPIPVDVELSTLNISSGKFLEVLKTHKIKALFITNLLGFCDDIDNITDLCKKNKIILIEDNCESLGSVYKEKMLGNFGMASTFSFYVGHHMSTIEGGAVCTDDAEFAQMLRLVRAHGWDRNLPANQQKAIRKKFGIANPFYGSYAFYDLGYNFRPTEINAFIGNVQLEYIDEIIDKRRVNFLTLASKIYKNAKYIPVRYDHMDLISNFAFPIICKNEDIKNKVISRCENKIEIRPIVGGDMTSQPFFRKYSKEKVGSLPNAKKIHKQGLYIGNNPELTKKDLQMIVGTLT